jgi:hypothetical protein
MTTFWWNGWKRDKTGFWFTFSCFKRSLRTWDYIVHHTFLGCIYHNHCMNYSNCVWNIVVSNKIWKTRSTRKGGVQWTQAPFGSSRSIYYLLQDATIQFVSSFAITESTVESTLKTTPLLRSFLKEGNVLFLYQWYHYPELRVPAYPLLRPPDSVPIFIWPHYWNHWYES